MMSWFRRIPRIEAQAVAISLAVSVTLLIIKFVAFFITQSAAIFSDAVESTANVLGASMALYALSVAHCPADKEHPYGHGKVEFLSALFEGSLVLMAGVFIIVRTIDAMWVGELVREQELNRGLWLVMLALVINGGVGLYLLRTGRRQGSMALEADGRHLMSDALTSLGVLVGLFMVKLTGWRYFDPITALFIGGYIAFMASTLLRRSVAMLMDKQDQEDVRLLTALLDAHLGPEATEPRICAYHKLRHRHSGRLHWVDLHIVVPSDWTIEQGHTVAGLVEREIEHALKKGDATAHVEPCNSRQCKHCHPDSDPGPQ